MPERDPEENEALGAAVVEIDVDLAREIDGRLAGWVGEPLLSVTDLIDPRIAYYRALHPMPPSPARAQRMAQGRRSHERIERLLAAPGQREVRLVRAGVVGRIDILAELPTEIKSTSAITSADRVIEGRPQYIDQLAIYCGLTDRTEGRILIVAGPPEGPTQVLVIDCRFRDPAELWKRTAAAAARLNEAFRKKSPVLLPRCAWFGRGCEYEAAHLCSCSGTEAEATEAPREELVDWRENSALAREIEEKLNSTTAPTEAAPIALYRELMYPRRAFFDRTTPAPKADEPRERGPPPDGAQPNLYQRIREALEAGAPGELVREVPPGDVPEEQLLRFRGELLLLKTSGVARPPNAAEVRDRHALFLFELGLRCAASGADGGRLLVAYDRVARESGPIRVFRVRLDHRERWERILARRRDLLREALRTGRPEGLPNCPGWMYDSCPYRAVCGDGPSAPVPLR
ncbi:MAG: PD-(D/E)XK nuclease family protein [Thermoplasmata archaeon]